MRKIISSLIILLAITSLSSPTFAIAENDPSVYLENIAKKLISAVEAQKETLKTDVTVAEKIVREHLLPVIDIEDFSKKTLGSTIWKSMSNEQHNIFIDGYINQIINKYAKGLSLYDGQDFIFEKSEIKKKSGNARVKSKMKQSGSEPLSIDYFLTKNSDEQWLIYNIVVEGVDMRDSYSTQFRPRINEIGMEQFLKELSAPSSTN